MRPLNITLPKTVIANGDLSLNFTCNTITCTVFPNPVQLHTVKMETLARETIPTMRETATLQQTRLTFHN